MQLRQADQLAKRGPRHRVLCPACVELQAQALQACCMQVQIGQPRVDVTVTAALIKLDAYGAEVGKPAEVISTARTARHVSTAQIAQHE